MSNYHKTFYLGGGMTNLEPDERNGWRNEMEELCSEYYHVNLFNPCNHWDIGDPNVNDREAMDYDIRRLRDADVLVVNFNDPSSLGTMAEIAIAYDRRKPILGICSSEEIMCKLHPWQIAMCDHFFKSVEDVCEYLAMHYCFND